MPRTDKAVTCSELAKASLIMGLMTVLLLV
jgi:hypothetical protein